MQHRRFVSSEFLRGESCGRVEVGMMISEDCEPFLFHIKVTVGDVRSEEEGGGGSVLGFLWKTLAYLAFASASGGWNSLSAEQERVSGGGGGFGHFKLQIPLSF